ncbi:MAG: hypothetical protein ACYDEJ_00450 [Desulfitobacteriaceae bacterium]
MDAEMKEMFGKLFEEIRLVKTSLTKQGIAIESMQTDIKTIAEVQKVHMEQNERDHKKTMEHIDDNIGLVGNVVKTHSEEISTLKRKIG